MAVSSLVFILASGLMFFLPQVKRVSYLIFIMILLLMMIFFNYSEGYFMDSLFFYDPMSMSLVGLSVWISLLMVLSSYKIYRFSEFSTYFLFFVSVLLLALVISFFCGSYLYFYFFFEVSLVPTLLIIVGWGYQTERLQAGLYFLFYTLTASLPLLIMFLYLYYVLGSMSFFYKGAVFYSLLGPSMWLILGLMGVMAFLVKLPMYFTHLWLPSAHVEAPVAGSMILAGVLLKLGGYGLMRLLGVTGDYMKYMSSYLVGLSLVGMIYVGLVCCRINDFKALVAYSSVAHMGMVICGVSTMTSWGYGGSLMMMIGHGLSSSGLFCIINMYYERTGSRSFYINKGLMLSFPIFSMLLFLLSAANIAAPPTINLFSEIFLMASILKFDYVMFLVFPIGSFLGAVFTLFMFSFSQHGASYYISGGFNFSNARELHILFLHVFPVNFLILNSNLLLQL